MEAAVIWSPIYKEGPREVVWVMDKVNLRLGGVGPEVLVGTKRNRP